MAVAITSLAIALAAASAWGRAVGLHHQILLAGVSVTIVIAVHFAPALLRGMHKLVLWPFWSVCLAGAMYMHASFMTAASVDAAAERLASSPAAAARAEQRAAIEQALSSIKAKPAAQIARQLSWTTDSARIAALQIELQESQRADALRAQLVTLAAGTAAAAAGATADPVAERLASMLGVTADSVGLVVSLLFALLLEVLGMMLWCVALAGKPRADEGADLVMSQAAPVMQQVPQVNVQPAVQSAVHDVMHADSHEPVPPPSDDLSRLRAAIERGDCLPTLIGIRNFMRCGQSRASDLRRALAVK